MGRNRSDASHRKATWADGMFWFGVYSLFGWMFEKLFMLVAFSSTAPRGFLHLPLCPIYGFSVLLFLVLFYGKKCRWPVVFLGCGAAVSILEYVTSWVLEALFGKIWWSYADWPLNFQGRISLFTSLGLALCGTLLVRVLHPALHRLSERFLSTRVRRVSGVLICALTAADAVLTALLEWRSSHPVA